MRPRPSLLALALARSFALVASGIALQGLPPAQAQVLDDQLRVDPIDPLGGVSANTPTYLQGDRMEGLMEDTLTLVGNASFRQLGLSLKGDRLDLDLVSQDLDAEGRVELFKAGDLYKGPRFRINLETSQGRFDDVSFFFPVVNGKGTATASDFLSPSLTELSNVQFSTCENLFSDWWLTSTKLKLDDISETAFAEDAALNWTGLGAIPLGDVSFATSPRRRSGILPGVYTVSSKLGLEVTQPYYVNIAPNRDLTFYPRAMSKRGLQLGAEARYLTNSSQGTLGIEYLPNDTQTSMARSLGAVQHTTRFSGNTLSIAGTRVSDDNYFADFGASLPTAAQRVLPGTVQLTRGIAGFATSLTVQSFQLLKDKNLPVIRPYTLGPRLEAVRNERAVSLGEGITQDLYLDYSSRVQLTRFTHPTLEEGDRAVAEGRLALPLDVGPFTITPSGGMHLTQYRPQREGDLSATISRFGIGTVRDINGRSVNTGPTDEYSRAVPSLGLDAKVGLERDANFFGTDFLQTLEPRAFYSYAPFRRQDGLPVFDSSEIRLNLGQIFDPRPFSGDDRIADQDQITVGVTSRFLRADTGEERLRVGFGQRYYFEEQRVTVPGFPLRSDKSSDLLGEVGVRLGRYTDIEAFGQYNESSTRWQTGGVTARVDPKPGQAFYAAYRFVRPTLNSVDLAFQTPITRAWSLVGRVNFSLQDEVPGDPLRRSGLIQTLAGVEYNRDCWVFRLVGQRFATATDEFTTAVFLQVELTGLGALGTNALGVLRTGIPGYRAVNTLSPLPALYENYQ